MLQNHQSFSRIIIALSLLLFGCIPDNSSSEIQKLVFPANCESACWMGIEPSVSTIGEALEILEKNYGSENVIRDESARVITWDAHHVTWHDRGIVFYSNNIVGRVLVWLSGDNVEVKSFVSDIGNPEGVALVVSGPDVKCAGASLVYSQTGLTAFLSSGDKSVGVRENQIINGLGIDPPWTSDDFPVTDTEVVPWDGYREYCPEKWSWEE